MFECEIINIKLYLSCIVLFFLLIFSFSLYDISHDASLKSDFMYYKNLSLENKIYDVECWCSDVDI